MTYPRTSLLGLPYSRLELPGWGRVLARFGVFRDDLWKNAPRRTIRGKRHGYRMDLDLSNWSERHSFFLGRFYELGSQLLIEKAVRPGETVIDVGANIGMITLLAARCVGPAGIVHSFEPNPQAAARVAASLQANQIRNVTLHPCGLADAESELTLKVLTENTGMGTFADVPANQKQYITATHRVQVRRGDDELPADLSGPALLKIDTEGFECRVIRGLDRTLRRLRPVITMEAMQCHLQRAGASLAELFELMRGYDYLPHSLGIFRHRLRYQLSIQPLKSPAELKENNVVWLIPGSVHAERLKPWITPG